MAKNDDAVNWQYLPAATIMLAKYIRRDCLKEMPVSRHSLLLGCASALLALVLLVQLYSRAETDLLSRTASIPLRISKKQPSSETFWNLPNLTSTSSIIQQTEYRVDPALSSHASHETFLDGEVCAYFDRNKTELIIPASWGDALSELLSTIDTNDSLVVLHEPLLKCLQNQTYCCHVFQKARYFHIGVLEDLYEDEFKLPPTWHRNRTLAYSVYWKQASYSFLISPLLNRGEYWYIPEVELDEFTWTAKAYLKFEITSLQFNSYLIHSSDSVIEPKNISQTLGNPANNHTVTSPRGLAVPTDLDFHLWISPHSSFVDCNSSIQELFYQQNPQQKNATIRVGSNSTYKLAYARDLLLQYGALPMLSSGTLLGWYRQCGTIPYTNDYDLMFPAAQYSERLLNAVACDNTVSINHVTGFPDRSLEISVIYKSVMVDLFLLYDKGDHTYLSTVDYNGYKMLREIYPPVKSTVAVDLNGYLFYAPSNAVEFFEAVYENWMEPVKNYVWYRSPKNLKVAGRYTREQWKQYHRQSIPCNKSLL